MEAHIERENERYLVLSNIIENAPYLLAGSNNYVLAGNSTGQSQSSSHSSNSSSQSASGSCKASTVKLEARL